MRHKSKPVKPSLSQMSKGHISRAQALQVVYLTVLSGLILLRDIEGLSDHASTEGSAWSTAKFHCHGGWCSI